ncbi:hypothetical protein C4588_07560 [Candidatus Parcubacteria bacterium]|jgi:hypothetical protein|nr:MAG: hypothetical protein C4588_07560 [Candidatus Parcubacteria bacterium]
MKLNLSEVPVAGQVNFSTSLSASKDDQGNLTVQFSQSQNKNFTTGKSESASLSEPIKGTEQEVIAKLTELGLSGLVE